MRRVLLAEKPHTAARPCACTDPNTYAKSASAGSRRYRLLMVSSHPVQYASPLCRLMAQHPKLDMQVAYCASGAMWDAEFGLPLAWDAPLTTGYPWVGISELVTAARSWPIFWPG